MAPAQHQALVRKLADIALDAARGHDVRCVTPDAEVAEWAVARGVRVVDDGGRDLNDALTSARDEAVREGAASVLVLLADLPDVTAGDVQAMLELPPCGVVLAPDENGTGTNALHVAAVSPLTFAFGPESFARHLTQAPDALVVRRPGLGRDLDELPDPSFAP